tara:strand:+ start:277 stop:627 length:351 start_codon:yes stop_codon:yes gene_type:complete
MKRKAIWECPECKSQTHFKGLCRECTEYDDNGTPTKPVNRIRLNHTRKEKQTHARTKQDFVNQRRPHPSKKQLDAIKDALNAQSRNLVDGTNDGEDLPTIHETISAIEKQFEGEEE